jgi:hypothetical protein
MSIGLMNEGLPHVRYDRVRRHRIFAGQSHRMLRPVTWPAHKTDGIIKTPRGSRCFLRAGSPTWASRAGRAAEPNWRDHD